MALLVVPGTSLFLNAYGSEWLPVSYIAVAVVGTTISWMVARAVRRFQLVAVATVALGAQVLLFCVSWVVLEAGGRWISAVLLVSFPLALQIGFVFVGGQAGRVLNVRELKELFPRIVSGFVIGFFIGGLAGLPLLALREEPQDLLFGAAVAQLAFVGLLIVTDRRIPAVRSDRQAGQSRYRRTSAAQGPPSDCARQPPDHRDLRLPSALGDGEPARRLPHVRPSRPPLSRCCRPDALGHLVHRRGQPRQLRRARRFRRVPPQAVRHTFRSDRQPRCRRSLVSLPWRSRGSIPAR